MSTFRHEPLRYTETVSSRFIKSHDRSQSQPVYFMEQLPLDRIRDYTAISYMWGSSVSTPSILLYDADDEPQVLEIGQNLFDFLEAHKTYSWGEDLWSRTQSYLWADQICINQSNPDERSYQVSIMNLIYKRAKRVLVWLGCEPDMAKAALRLQDTNGHDTQALATLLTHPYFSRLWIIQEVSLSTELVVICREVKLNWKILVESINRLKESRIHSTLSALLASSTPDISYPGFSRSGIPAPALALIRESGHLRHRSLKRCIANFCRNGCQDPRDKVYALLGLTSERWRVCVDYKKTVLEVYIDAVRALFEELFDRLDPQCFYKEQIERNSGSMAYLNTTLILAEAMGLPPHQVKGLPSFLKNILLTYLDTPLRNIQFLCDPLPKPSAAAQKLSRPGRMPWNSPSRQRNVIDSPGSKVNLEGTRAKKEETIVKKEETIADREEAPAWTEETIAKPEKIIATRRNPLMQDVIPAMGLHVAQLSTEGVDGQGSRKEPALDRWWFEHNGDIHSFDCPAIAA